MFFKIARLSIFFLFVAFISQDIRAVERIDITKGTRDPLPIAVNDFIGSNENSIAMGKDITRVINANLERTGLFKIIDKVAFLDKIDDLNKTPKLISWRQINAAALVVGKVKISKSSEMEVEFKLWDPYTEQLLTKQIYNLDVRSWRRAAHKISDTIYKRMTGEEGYFDTKIAYISESGPAQKRVKRLTIMDQDGENSRFLTSGKNMALTPRFSPDGKKILYLSMPKKAERVSPKVYIRDVYGSGKEQVLGSFHGMSFAPRFSPNGKQVLISVADKGNTDIYLLNLLDNKKTRITNDPAIDVSPCFSPNGEKIVFTSDRGGSEQLYVMNQDGSDVKRISFGSGSYSTPVWSPREDYIVFTKKVKGSGFFIGVMRPDGTGERILSQGYLVEGPDWSPNGRVIIFASGEPSFKGKAGASKLYTIDLSGYNERELLTPVDASDPSWSPIISDD